MKEIGLRTTLVFLTLLLSLVAVRSDDRKGNHAYPLRARHHHHNRSHSIHVERHAETRSDNATGIWCYTCMSGPLSDLSRAIFLRSLQIPAEAESAVCDDPFSVLPATSQLHSSQGAGARPGSLRRLDDAASELGRLDFLVQPCQSSCLKAVLQSHNAKIVLRGCLTSIYQQISARDYFFSMPSVGSCDEQAHESQHIGATVTQTCLCSSDYCNSSRRPPVSFWALMVVPLVPYLFVP